MNAWQRLSLALVGCLFTVLPTLALVGAAPAAVPPPIGECAVGDALSAAGQSGAATKEYVSLLRRDPTLQCATKGLQALKPSPAGPCAIAGRLVAFGLREAAKSYLQKAMEEGGPACPDESLQGLAPPACLLAKQLFDAGAKDEAQKVLEAALATGTACEDVSLEEVTERSFPDKVANVAADAAKLIPLAVAMGLVALILLFAFRRKRKVRAIVDAIWTPSIVIGPFNDPGDGPKASGALAARVRADFQNRGQVSGTDLSITIVDAHQEIAAGLGDLEKISASLAPAFAVARVAARVLQPRKWTLDGQLESAHRGAVACSAAFKDATRLTSSCRFIARIDPGPDARESDYLELSLPVAAWTAHEALRQLNVAAGLTTTSSSYAWLVAGVAAQQRGDLTRATYFYEQSLAADPTHVRARIALAIARSLAVSADEAIIILQQALDEIEGGVP